MTVFAIVPVKDLRGTKSRLSPVLDPGGRAGLTLFMMDHVLTAVSKAGVERICVVSPDSRVLEMAAKAGVETLLQRTRGLNPALNEARKWAMTEGATAMLVLPADLPLIGSEDVQAVLDAGVRKGTGTVVISPDARDSGTNALLVSPPNVMPFVFGPGSYEAHLLAACQSRLAIQHVTRRNLAFDLDTRDDLAWLRGRGDFPLGFPQEALHEGFGEHP